MWNQVKLRGILPKVLILSALVVGLLTLPPASPIQAQSDDYSDKRSQAALIRTDGAPRVGTINPDPDLLDIDYFKFQTRRGVRYTFELAFVDRGENTLKDANLKVLNSDKRGSSVSNHQVESRTESSKSVTWVARTTDIYFLTVSTAYATGTITPYLGQYRLSAHEEPDLEDIHPDARDQSERVTFGSQYQGAISPWSNQPSLSGTIHEGDDYDFFTFEAIRGAKYTFTATLSGMDGLKIEVTESGGSKTLASNKGLGNSLEWVAQNTGSYYVTLTGSPLVPKPVGAYTLQVDEDGTLRDRYPDSQGSANPINLGNFIPGAISPRDDKDFFSFPAERGVEYTIDIDMAEGAAVHIEVRDGSNVIKATNRGIGSSLAWTAETQGDTYIGISASLQLKDPVVNYNFRITGDNTMQDRHAGTKGSATRINLEIGIAAFISPPGDRDYFFFDAKRGVSYTINASLGSIPGLKVQIAGSDEDIETSTDNVAEGIEWTAPEDGTYYLIISGLSQRDESTGAYNIRIDGDNTMQDRHAGTKGSATRINLEIGIAAFISPPGDRDYFSFDAKRGVSYTIKATLGSIPGLRVQIAGSDRDIETSTDNVAEGIEWTAPEDGTYYLIISGLSQRDESTGAYNIRIDGDNTMEDRHGDDQAGATPIGYGNPVSGAISPDEDRDYFSFDAKRGVSYTIKATLGSIPGLRVQIAGSDRDIETSTDNVAEGIEWTAPEDGTYYLIISGLSQRDESTGAYNIRIDGDNSLEDRHGDDQAGATPIGYGNLVSGAISPDEDRDYFSFEAKRGVAYTFKLAYDGLEAVSVTVEGEGDHSGVLASNFGQGLEVVWIAPDDGKYFLSVSNSPMVIEGTGNYTLEISADTSLEDRHEGDYLSATKIGIGSAISAAISPADDQDYFLFAAEKGTTYTLDVELGTAESLIMTISHRDSGFTQTNFGSGEDLQWTAPAKGEYIVLVAGMAQTENPVGTYRVTMRRGELPEVSVAQPLPVDSSENPVLTPEPKAETETRVEPEPKAETETRVEPEPKAETETRVEPETKVEPEPPAVPSGAVLRVGSRTAGPGATVLVPVRLERGEQVGTLGFNVNYDPTVARAVRVYRGARMSPATFSFNAAVPGLIRIGAAARAEVSEDGSAAVIEFRTVGDRGSYSDVTISDMVVSDASGELRSIQVHHGLLTVESAEVGDGNGDGRVTAVDALIAMRMFVGLVSEDLVMDMNGDGRVTLVDSMEILNLARRG